MRDSIRRLLHHFPLKLILFFIIIWTMKVSALTELDYHLGQSKYGDSSISEDESFHGTSSALLSVDRKGNYIRVSITMDEPLSMGDLNQLSMWLNPQSGNGNLQLELFLDGDGDGGYDSDSSRDARLRSVRESWSELGMSSSRWNELDGFDLIYEKYGDKAFPAGSMNECQERLKGKSIVRLYITIYKDGNAPKTSVYIDYIKLGAQIISFEPLEDEDMKKGPKSVSPGGQITYTITYGNNNLVPTDVVVSEQYDPRTFFLEASPAPDTGTNDVWTFHQLPPGAHGQIIVKVKTRRHACKANIKGEVSGDGYAFASGTLSTNFDSYPVTNSVTISAGEFKFSASATTTVREIEGSILEYNEHGSGLYSCRNTLAYSPSSISVYRDFNGSLGAVSLLQDSISIQCAWFASLRGENEVRDIHWYDRYYQGSFLNLSSRLQLAKSQSFLETYAHFAGSADRTSKWSNVVTDQRFSGEFTLTKEARAKWSNKSLRSQDDELDCCPLIQGWQEPKSEA